MRKLFTFLFAALMSAGMWAEPITVTWNGYDMPSSGSGKSFTKDGVTITCGGIEWEDLDFYNGGTFTTDLGNFTKIEVYAGMVTTPFGEGWSGNSERQTWTGNASSVSFSGEFMSDGEEVILTFTIEPAASAGKPIVVFEANGKKKEVEIESFPHTFKCDLEYKDGELDGIIADLYALPKGGYCDFFTEPVATGNTAVTAGEDDDANHFITISKAFEGTARVSGKYYKYINQDDEEIFNYSLTISIKAGTPTAIDNTPSLQGRSGEASKIIRDGMLLIEKNGKLFNVTGVQVR